MAFSQTASTAAGKVVSVRGLSGAVFPLKVLWGGAWTLFPLQSGKTPSITFPRESEKRWSRSESKLPVGCM